MNGLDFDAVISRQEGIAKGEFPSLGLPRHDRYVVCNLRGGIGKTTLSFNLSFLADDVLAIDTCPQGNLSFFFDNQYYANAPASVKDLILPYLIPGLGKASRTAAFVGATNPFFSGKNTYYVPSSEDLYLLPSQLMSAINQTSGLQNGQRKTAVNSILFSLKQEIEREMEEIGSVSKCLIDTSPFFAGATQLAWYAADALIVPVRTDNQSVKSLELLIHTLTSPQSEFRRYLGDESHSPRIQMVVMTHCGWNTAKGARNEPNKQTKIYVKKVIDILSRGRTLLTTDDPSNHLFLLDDFLGSGRISSALSKPIELLKEGEARVIDRVKVTVNSSVVKCQNQLKFINSALW
jgi:cellulose biosynthesis protein BcsQ